MKILLTEYSADSETEGVVKFDGHVIEGATALWCANLLRSLPIFSYLDFDIRISL